MRGAAKNRLDRRLREILDPGEYSFAPIELNLGALHTTPLRKDLGSLFTSRPCCVLIPSTARKAHASLRLLGELGIPVTIRGGATDPAGSSLVLAGEALLLTRGLREPLAIDRPAGTVKVGTGWDIDSLEQRLNDDGFTLGVMPRHRSGSTLGGFLSGPGWGEGSLGRGSLNERVLSLTLAPINGPAIEIDSADQSVPLKEILGGEGQYGLITRARIELKPLSRPNSPYYFELERESDFPGLVMELVGSANPPHSLLMFSASCSPELNRLPGIDINHPLVIAKCTEPPKGHSVQAGSIRLETDSGAGLHHRLAHGFEGGSAHCRLLLPGELTAPLSEMTREGEPALRVAMEALHPDRYLVHLTIPCKPGSPEESIAARRMCEVRDRLIAQGAEPCGYGFWQQGELAEHRGDFQLRALQALRGRFDLKGLVNRGRTLELRTKHGTLTDASILKPGTLRVKGLFGGGR